MPRGGEIEESHIGKCKQNGSVREVHENGGRHELFGRREQQTGEKLSISNGKGAKERQRNRRKDTKNSEKSVQRNMTNYFKGSGDSKRAGNAGNAQT